MEVLLTAAQITQSLIQLLYWYTQLHKLQKLSQSLMRTPPPTTPPQRYKLLPVVLFHSTLFDYLLLCKKEIKKDFFKKEIILAEKQIILDIAIHLINILNSRFTQPSVHNII